jgi:hypothetical protein
MLDPVARRTAPMRITTEWQALGTLSPEAWRSTSTDWLPWVHMQVGDLQASSDAIARIGNRTLEGYNRSIFFMARASLLWMQGDLVKAARDLDQMERRGISSRWAHTYYPLAAEIAADRGRLDDVRRAAEQYLAMEVHPTREAAKLGVLYPLVRAHVDAALASGVEEHTARATDAIGLMHRVLSDTPPTARAWTSVMTHTQNITFAEAELTRLTGPSPDHWRHAVDEADYLYYEIYARWRLGEALLQSNVADEGGREVQRTRVDAHRSGMTALRHRIDQTARRFGVEPIAAGRHFTERREPEPDRSTSKLTE